MMPDREKVIEGLENLRETIRTATQYTFTSGGICAMNMKRIDNALDLLKEQEAVTIKKTKEHGFGVYGGICPKCRNWIQSAHSFCGFCGQAVKWE